MTRALTREQADALARTFGHLDAAWSRAAMAEAFAEVVPAPAADELARRVIDLVPTEPVGGAATLGRILVDLPSLPEVVAPLELIARMRFGAIEIADLAALAGFLDLTPSELEWFADRGQWLRRASTPLSHYRYRLLPKETGVRLVEAPKVRLREIQRRILRHALDGIPAHPSCHGFEKGCSAATFAEPHAGADVVVRLDLRDFFASIPLARVRAVFTACGYARPVSRVLAELCTTAAPVEQLRALAPSQRVSMALRHLPQGAPTSPALANLVARGLDRRLTGYAAKAGLTYTRYADDLAFSGPASTAVDHLVWSVTEIARAEGFTVNPPKTRVRRAHQRQVLAGLVVNTSPAVPRGEYDALRALLHNCLRTGPTAQNHTAHPHFRAHVYGRIAWIGETSPVRRDKLLAAAARVDWTR